MSTGSEHGYLITPQADWFFHQPTAPPARMIPWSLCRANDFHQASAVPFRRQGTGLEFCLITSSSGRWMFPKGLINPGDTLAQTAWKEALEEAGLHGQIVGEPLGRYEARKGGRILSVVAMLMEVTRADDVWQESNRRQRCWADHDRARQLLSQPELVDCLEAAWTRLRPSG